MCGNTTYAIASTTIKLAQVKNPKRKKSKFTELSSINTIRSFGVKIYIFIGTLFFMFIQNSIIFIATLVAVYTDLKKREVPNFISYFLIAFGIGSAAIGSAAIGSAKPILFSIVGAVMFYVFGAALYYMGVWGGGDAKLLTGFGASLANVPAVVAWPFLLTILFNVLFFGALLGIVFSAILFIRHWKKVIAEARQLLRKYKLVVFVLYAMLILVILLYFVQRDILFTSFVWASAVVFFYLLVGLKAIEKTCMYRFVSSDELVEGDWIAEPVKYKGKIIYKPERTGVSPKELNRLKKLKIKQIRVKDGLPYVPAFLASLLVSFYRIDVMFILFMSILR